MYNDDDDDDENDDDDVDTYDYNVNDDSDYDEMFNFFLYLTISMKTLFFSSITPYSTRNCRNISTISFINTKYKK